MLYEKIFEEIAVSTKSKLNGLFSEESVFLDNDNIISIRDYIIDNNLESVQELLYSRWIKWHNNNSFDAIEKILRNKKSCDLCKLLFFVKNIKKESNFGSKCFTLDEFNNSLDSEITLWRGGSGEYDPEVIPSNRNWVSYTASRNRANTFSKYSGTQAMKTFMLPENDHYWILELKIKLRDILAYYDVGDNEVIVSVNDSKKAIVIVKK